MACRSLLRKLAEREVIDLPSPRCTSPNRFRHKVPPLVAHDTGASVEEGTFRDHNVGRVMDRIYQEGPSRIFSEGSSQSRRYL